MSKEILNSHIPLEIPADANVSKLADSVIFSPTAMHRKWKIKFWSRFVPNPLTDVNNITIYDIDEIIRDSRISKYWGNQGFKDWFLNTDENREKLEYLFQVSLEVAEEILFDPEANTSAKVNMVKVLAELANKFPSKNATERFVDDEINKMSESQLKAYLERRGVTSRTTKALETIQVPATIDLKVGEKV
jgi:hypothetical protein